MELTREGRPLGLVALTLLLVSSSFAGCAEREYVSLEELTGVTLEETPTAVEGYTYYVMRFDQPVDHDEPRGERFSHRASLLHRDPYAPLVVVTTGYDDYYRDRVHELTRLLGANQISIEHRYFGESRPAREGWEQLTIEQMARDEHVILDKLQNVYHGAFLSAGASKGGMTATYHRRFFPDDVDGTVAYVAPISFALGDPRYPPFQDDTGPPACRQAIRDAAVAMLRDHRAALEERLIGKAVGPGYEWAQRSPESALEENVMNLEWQLWQYTGVRACELVPGAGATADELWAFLQEMAPLRTQGDITRLEPYYEQTMRQLGFPVAQYDYLAEHLIYQGVVIGHVASDDEDGAYDGGAAMRDINDYVRKEADDILFIYGEWDPWTAGAYTVAPLPNARRFFVRGGTHGSKIADLAPPEQQTALRMLEEWTGVVPFVAGAARLAEEAPREGEEEELRLPPPMRMPRLR